MISMTVFYLLNYDIDIVNPNEVHIGGSKKKKKNVKLSRKNKLVKNKITKKRHKRQKYRK
jgi:hypothetical protein